MAYSVHNISAITDIPALVSAFAATNGFDVDNSLPNEPIITCPGDSNSVEENVPMQIHALISGLNNQNHELWWSEAAESNSLFNDVIALVQSPKLGTGSATTANPSVSLPTRVHLFGTAVATDYPFIAIVVEYGLNSYRHLYFGKMEARGGYTGREVYASDNGQRNSDNSTRHWRNPSIWSPMFGHYTSNTTNLQRGGVRVQHVDNPVEFRLFDGPVTTTSPWDEFTGDEVVGGFGDGFNEGFVMRGKSSFAGMNLLVPVNLYAAEPILGDTSLRPIGRPPGIRMVNVQDLEPGQQITVGNETWRVFPAKSKSASVEQVPVSGSTNWPAAETSYYFGYAYLEEDAP